MFDVFFFLSDTMREFKWLNLACHNCLHYTMCVISLFMYYLQPSDKWLHELVVSEYVGATNDRNKVRDGLREFTGDFFFNIPSLKVAKYHKGITHSLTFIH